MFLGENAMNIGIIGKGNVGSALCEDLSAKHEVKFGHRDPKERARYNNTCSAP